MKPFVYRWLLVMLVLTLVLAIRATWRMHELAALIHQTCTGVRQ